jgi:hypothetical protein
MISGTVTIDDSANDGSDAGAWLTHIAHTPALRSQCFEDFPGARLSGRTESAPIAVRPTVTQAGGTGEVVSEIPLTASPAPFANGCRDA